MSQYYSLEVSVRNRVVTAVCNSASHAECGVTARAVPKHCTQLWLMMWNTAEDLSSSQAPPIAAKLIKLTWSSPSQTSVKIAEDSAWRIFSRSLIQQWIALYTACSAKCLRLLQSVMKQQVVLRCDICVTNTVFWHQGKWKTLLQPISLLRGRAQLSPSVCASTAWL